MAFRYQWEWTGLSGSPWLSTFHLDLADPSEVQAGHDALFAALDTAAALFAPEVQVQCLPEVYDLTTPSTVAGVYPVTTEAVQGDNTSGTAARATQGLIRLFTQTFSGNRRVQGKIFLPAVCTSSIDPDTGRPTGGYQSFATAFGTDLVNLGLQVASRKLDAFAPVTSAAAWSEFAVLRSRRD